MRKLKSYWNCTNVELIFAHICPSFLLFDDNSLRVLTFGCFHFSITFTLKLCHYKHAHVTVYGPMELIIIIRLLGFSFGAKSAQYCPTLSARADVTT